MTRLLAMGCSLLLATAVCGCSSGKLEGQSDEPLPRPVTVRPLTSINPSTTLAVTGSLAAWKTEDIGFQVSGRIEKIYFESGENVVGRTFDENGVMLTAGDTIAELEPRRYELAYGSAVARLEASLAQVQAAEDEIASIIPKRIASARALATFYDQEFRRVKTLYEDRGGTVTKSQYDKARSDLDKATADLQEQQLSEDVKKAELEALKAQAREAAEAVEQAEKDLADTRLVAPYHGQIADVEQIEGGFVQPGRPVVRMQMMDPLKVEISVSPETDRRVNLGDLVDVYLDENSKIEGYVWFKDTVADPATRTFRLQLLVRNQLVETGLPEGEAGSRAYRAGTVGNLFTETNERRPPYFVPVGSRRRALYEDAKGYFVWRVAETLAPQPGDTDKRYRLEKVRVTPGDERMPFLQVATFRELVDLGDFDPEHDLLAGNIRGPDGKRLVPSGLEPPESIRPEMVPFDVEGEQPRRPVRADADDDPDGGTDTSEGPPDVEEEKDEDTFRFDAETILRERQQDLERKRAEAQARREAARKKEFAVWDEIGDELEVVYVRRRWLLRPGDYVRVDLRGEDLPEGFYVPMDAVVQNNGKYHVVVAVDDPAGGTKAKHVPVTVADSVAERGELKPLRQIEQIAVSGDDFVLDAGARIVVSGAYYVVDGEPLAIARTVGEEP